VVVAPVLAGVVVVPVVLGVVVPVPAGAPFAPVTVPFGRMVAPPVGLAPAAGFFFFFGGSASQVARSTAAVGPV
jgi:hypothetical protein